MKELFKRNLFLIFLILIIFLATFLRLWRLPEYMTFLGDEGRDALAVRAMIVDYKFRLIGPVTSIGNMYLGPLYYYLMLPAMLVSGLSPVGPAVMIALLGIATVGLIYWIGKEWFDQKTAIIAAFLYALSPIIIIYSRSSWNPNIMPFFALLSLFGIWRVWVKRQFWWLPIIGLTFSFAIQSHWLGLLLLPTIGFFWAWTLIAIIKDKKNKKTLKPFLLHTFFSILVFAFLTIAPLVWFDLRHNFINFNAFKAFFTDRQATVNFKVYKAIPGLWELITSIFTRLVAAKEILSGIWLTLFVLLFTVVYLIFQTIKKGKNFLTNNKGLVFILVWLLVGILGLGNYKQHIYDHYFGFLAPVPFLLTGWVLVKIWDWTKWSKVLSLVLIGFLVFLAVKQSPLANQPNRQLQRTEKVAQFVVEKSRGERFNLALIAERNYDDAYAYFLELWKKPLVRIDPQMADETITQQLFVICEQLPCQPVGHPKAEIAMFGWVKIEEQWQIEGVEVYKLIHNPDQK